MEIPPSVGLPTFFWGCRSVGLDAFLYDLSIRQLRRSCCWWTTSCNQLGCFKLYQTLDHGISSISTIGIAGCRILYINSQSCYAPLQLTIKINRKMLKKQGSLYHQPNNALRGNPSELPYVCIVFQSLSPTKMGNQMIPKIGQLHMSSSLLPSFDACKQFCVHFCPRSLETIES